MKKLSKSQNFIWRPYYDPKDKFTEILPMSLKISLRIFLIQYHTLNLFITFSFISFNFVLSVMFFKTWIFLRLYSFFFFLHFFFLGMVLIPVSRTMSRTPSIVPQQLYQIQSPESVCHFHYIIIRELI